MGLIARKAEPSSRSYLAGARLQEHNDRVEANLDPWEIATWRRHRYAKDAHGRPLFHGAPDQKARQFREWLEGRGREVGGERSRAAERKVTEEVRRHGSRAKATVPCAPGWRYRTKAACKGEPPRAWGRLLGRGSTELDCGPPHRARVKDLCVPSKGRERRWLGTVAEVEEPHAFEGLI